MATLKQKRLANNIVENATKDDPLNKRELLVSAGYSEITAGANPQRIIEQEGVQEELNHLGFNESTAKEVVGEILLDETVEPQHRLKAADMVFDVHGSYAPDKHINLNLDANSTERTRELGTRLIGLFRR